MALQKKLFLVLVGITSILYAQECPQVGAIIPGQSLWEIEKRIAGVVDFIESAMCIIESKVDILDIGPLSINAVVSQVDAAVSGIDSVISAISIMGDVLESKIEAQKPACTAEILTGPTTITESGNYCVNNSFSGSLIIDADNVSVDVNGYVITGDVTIADHTNVEVWNGTIDGNGSDALVAQSGCSDIQIHQIVVRNAQRGIYFDTVSKSTVSGCMLLNNTTGLQLENSFLNTIEKTQAKQNTDAGFDLISSTTNCFKECKAIDTGKNNAAVDGSVFGFVSDNGADNIFERCIANATQNISATAFSTVVAGFGLKGSEKCTKIIDSESANAVTSVGNAVAYGIWLETQTTDLLQSQTAAQTTNAISSLDWSGDDCYLAAGNNAQLQMYTFDPEFTIARSNITSVASLTFNNTIQSLAWSPDTISLAVVTSDPEQALNLVTFERTNLTLENQSSIDRSELLNSVSWRFDARYVVVGGVTNASTGNQLEVYTVDRVANSLTFAVGSSAAASIINSVSWHPTENLIAAGSDDEVIVFSFTSFPAALAVEDSESTGEAYNVVSWSPDGSYIATGSPTTVRIYLYDQTNNELSLAASYVHGGTIESLDWSDDGAYLAFAGANGTLQDTVVLSFNRSTNTLSPVANVSSATTGQQATAVSWGASGDYIAVGNNETTFGEHIFIYKGLTFPLKNVITGNVIYCNNQGKSAASGSGISGSAQSNMIIGNTGYNNPRNFIFVPNVFNQLFGQAPSDLQNISLDGCQAISTPDDIALIIKQTKQLLCSALDQLTSVDAIDLTEIVSTLDNLTACQPTVVTSAGTLSDEGVYCLAQNVTGDFTIAGSSIVFNLNNHKVTGTITVNSSLQNITLQNGLVDANNASVGIFIDSGTSNITIEDITVRNADRGMLFDTVDTGLIRNCSFTQNNTGLALQDSVNVKVFDSMATNNTYRGYDLVSSSTNCFIDCKALSTGRDNSDVFNTTVAGFVSTNGFGNIFERCIANATQALSTTDSNSLVAGFALRGNEHCTKIIDSESANAHTSNTGVTVPYGIVLEGTLDQVNTLTGYDYNTDAQTVSWSSDQTLLAVGLATGSGNEVRIVAFDSVHDATTQIASQSIGSTVSAISWAPGNARYLAVGTEEALQVYMYESVNNSLTLQDMAITDMVNAIDWSSDGQYLAVATNAGSGNELRIYAYNTITNTLTLSTSISLTVDANSVSWLPNNELLAVGIDSGAAGDELRLYTFDRATNSLTLADSVSIGAGVTGVDFSFDGYYLAIGTGSGGTELQVFTFNNETNALTLAATAPAVGAIFDVSWSADGSYIVSSGNVLRVHSFNRSDSSLTLVDSAGVNPNESRFSPDGAFIASAGPNPNTLQELTIFSAIQFPMKNVITNNTVYCNGHNFTTTIPGATGVGISGSSVANMIIGNTAYNNPPSSSQLIVGSNYVFVTNVFNPLFGQAPTALQNISLDGCEPITSPDDIALILKQTLAKECSSLDSLTQIDLFEAISKIDAAQACSPTPINSAQTISSSGSYALCQSIDGTLTIAASNVVLDLNTYTINGQLTIEPVSTVQVEHGVVSATGTNAVQVDPGASTISFFDVTVKNGTNGIFMNGVAGGTIIECQAKENSNGIVLQNSYGITIKQCKAVANTQIGYSLISSFTNCVLESKAISTGQGNTSAFDNNVFGFASQNGSSNIFERCIAHATQALSTTDFNSIVAGFALLGDETCSKIIECEAANSEPNALGVTVPFGIYLQTQTTDLLITKTEIDYLSGNVSSVSWTPDGAYVAFWNNMLRIFDFDRNTSLMTQQVSYVYTGTINELAFDPGNTYIAFVGTDNTESLVVLEFLRCNDELRERSSAIAARTGDLNSLSWRFDGNYIVAGGVDDGGIEVELYFYNRVKNELTDTGGGVAHPSTVNSVAWHPSGLYVAAGGSTAAGNIAVYPFDQTTESLSAASDSETHGADVFSVAWSSDGKILAIGGDTGTGSVEIRIYSFNENSGTLTELDTIAIGAAINAVDWSDDGRYLVVGASDGINDVFVFYFDRGTNEATQVAAVNSSTGSINAVQWSPDGTCLAVGQDLDSSVNFRMLKGLTFPQKNVIKNNTVYCNKGNQYPGGSGISGSSIANLIIQNTAYNNPQNYLFDTNTFNELFGLGPTLLQDIALDSNQPILQPDDIDARLQHIESLLEALVAFAL